jgi:cell division septum initiation protein DivIVA
MPTQESRRLVQRMPRFAALVLGLALVTTPGRAADALEEAPAPRPATDVLTLKACRQIALQHQPAIAAAQATLAAAIDRAEAVANLHTHSLLAPDLPIRRQQAPLGIAIARGGVIQAEADSLYGVTYSYLAALYAHEQLTYVVPEIREKLNSLRDLVTDPSVKKSRRDIILVDPPDPVTGRPEVNYHAVLVDSYLNTLEGRKQEAEQGQQRALAALREAMAVGPDFPLSSPVGRLPCPSIEPQKEALIALALARRGELIQASNAAAVVALEIEAQGTTNRSTLRTFAAGSDIHARPVPTGIYEGLDYKPGAVGLEMPSSLSGCKTARQAQARDYHQRAEAVVAKVVNLITLEVTDLYYRWQEKSNKAKKLEEAFRQSQQFSEKLKNSFNVQARGTYPNIDEVLHAGLITTRLRLEWKEAQYQSLLALLALERATAGGLCVDFDAEPACDGKGEGAKLPDVKISGDRP